MIARAKRAIAFICVVIGLTFGWERAMATDSDSQLPRETIIAVVENNDARDRLFDRLKEFSDRQAFAIRIAPSDPIGESFLIQMWREDIKVIGVNTIEPTSFDLGFFDTCPASVPLRTDLFDLLVNDFKNFMSDVPGVTLQAKKK